MIARLLLRLRILLHHLRRRLRASRSALAASRQSNFNISEPLESRQFFDHNIFHEGFDLFTTLFLANYQQLRQNLGQNTTLSDFSQLFGQTQNTFLNQSGLGSLNSLQVPDFVFNSGLGTIGLTRDPLTGFNPITDIGPGFTQPVYRAVTNDIATRFGGNTVERPDYLGVFDAYGLNSVPGAGFAPQQARFNLGIVQNGTSFLARRPDGSLAQPSDYNLPYTNDGLFNPGALTYGSVYANPYNNAFNSPFSGPGFFYTPFNASASLTPEPSLPEPAILTTLALAGSAWFLRRPARRRPQTRPATPPQHPDPL